VGWEKLADLVIERNVVDFPSGELGTPVHAGELELATT
jgi:hypothetical protein